MASTQVENQQMDFPVGSGSTVPRNSGTRRFDLSSRVVVSGQGPSMGNAQTTESQGSGSQLPVKVTVLRAHNIPHKKQFGLLRRRFYVTVADHATMRQTRSVQIDGQMVQWDQVLDAFFTQRSSHLTLCLYEKKRFSHNDVVIGTHADIPIESKNDAPFVLSNGDEKVGQSIQPTIFLTITVPANMASESRISSNNPPKTRIEGGDSPADGVTKPSMPDSEGSIRSTAFEPPLPSSDPLPVEPGTPILVRENAAVALRHVDNTMRSVDLANTWRGAVSGIKLVMDSVSQVAELHPLAKMAYNLVSLIPKTLLDQYGRDDNVLTLLEAMHDAFDLAPQENALRSIQPDSKQAKILTLMLHDVCNCSDFIQSYAQDSDFWKRTLKNIDGSATKVIKGLSDTLSKHRQDFLDHATIIAEMTTIQILDDVGILSAKANWISTRLEWVTNYLSEAELDRKIDEIPYGTGLRFTPDKGCLPRTRTAFLDFIVNWVNNPASERCLVLFGQAGSGKSAIAHEIARRFDTMHRLTSSIIFVRKEQPKPYHLFTTLARDLSDRYPSFKTALGTAVKGDSSRRVGAHDYATLFQSLIVEPLKGLHIVGPILVVIDALDESGDATGRNGLHTFLSKNVIELPPNFRVLITSRPEHVIVSTLEGAPSVIVKQMEDPELAATTRDDILTFLQKDLPSDEFETYGSSLADKAERLFQWAAVASQFILDPPESFGWSKKKCIDHLLKLNTVRRGQDPLDDLYTEILRVYFTNEETRLLFRSVVGQLITSIEPLTIQSLTALRLHAPRDDGGDGDPVLLLRRLSSLLSNVGPSKESLPIVPLHTSFRDFLTNSDKSGEFYVNPRHAHRQMAHSCLGILLKDLKFNVCLLESSYLPNKIIKDLKSRVNEHITPGLLYACRFWDDHLEHFDFETDLFRKIRTFFKEKFLFWLEVLSLASNVGLASPAFLALNAWLASGRDHVSQTELEEFRSFVNDASVFVRYFGMAMAKSAPHIYLSALPFAPTRSLVSAHYSGSFPRILHVECGQLSHWPSSEMVIPNVGGKILSISLSPDGQRIVSGSDDGTIRVWNTTTGETAANPFTGHVAPVRSVAFSPDGHRIVSGSSDGTIRVWDATKGETEIGPFNQHSKSVWSVAFSPNGQRIVSGSDDGTIQVWNAATGETAAAGPFTGHTDSVRSVAFSPDGQHIASGSSDETICVWNATTGEREGDPLTGHTSSVWSVAFSSDNHRIVSGSDDGTIRVWDATTGEAATEGPFTGHMSSVRSVSFSPDGHRIVSGSSDQTIRVWNAVTGDMVAAPFTGHTHPVWFVAFSPDGQRVVSGSDDETIRVWNATMGETVAVPFTGHTSSVLSVAFSPNGRRVVSGSSDESVCVWNAATGKREAGPLTGHTSSVLSVAFSPDGQRIVSGSSDRTIRVWDATIGATAAGPFTGHTSSVLSVTFSPDGQRIFSGSEDGTVRVWNATTGEMAVVRFTGHTHSVLSVAFSQDVQRVVSGLDDRKIHVRDTTTGGKAAGPFTGHMGPARSVAFSPDGQRVVSGSDDGTIRVWDVTTGKTEAGPFIGNTDSIWSLAFSPDGKHVVSGSDDGTIRVWDSTTGEMVAGPFTGHTDSVRSVAFSPDGQYIASGSHDGAIRLWSATTVRTETIGDVDFTDDTAINNEGWICGSNGELLVWIPSIHRAHLHRPGNIWVAGGYETRINFSPSVHGRSWKTCIEAR